MVRKRVRVDCITTESRTNELFEKYYKGQVIVEEEEWPVFYEFLTKDLPITFRVTGFRDQNDELLKLIKERFSGNIFKLPDSLKIGDECETNLFSNIPWYPGERAWQLDVSKYTVRKSESLRSLKQFLVSETESGNISRQEAVSMLPPLVLDIQSHHKILDMCAAPGSKSAQVVELLHKHAIESSSLRSENLAEYCEPTGLLIANDVDQRRCHMMIHQIRRLQSPCVMITHQDATQYPRLYTSETNDKSSQLLFDRVLVDVPCSGDGTLRKNPDIWVKWTPNNGNSNHGLQLRILRRGLELLRDPKPGCLDYPRLVYSTCSLNPIENEAVVANLLQASQGSIRLIAPELLRCGESCSSCTVKARPGLSNWRVMNKKGEWYSKYEEVPSSLQQYLRPSMFPVTDSTNLHLEHCRRIVPHDQNTGGFFIAVLEKLLPLPWMKTFKSGLKTQMTKTSTYDISMKPSGTSTSATENTSSVTKTVLTSTNGRPLKKFHIFNENPFNYFVTENNTIWKTLSEYYQITTANTVFGNCKFSPSNILSRSLPDENSHRCLYYTNDLIKKIITTNSNREGVKIINAGVRLFEMMDDKQYHGYRILQDGVEIVDNILPHTGGRRLHLTSNEYPDLVLMLQQEMPLVSLMSESTQQQFNQLSIGPVLIDYKPNMVDGNQLSHHQSNSPQCRLVFAGWRGLKSLRHYLGRHERLHVMRLANLEPTPCVMGHTGNKQMLSTPQTNECDGF